MPADDVSEWPTGRLLSTAARLVEQEWNAVLARNGLNHAGLLTLHALRHGPHSQRELAACSFVEEQTMSRVLDRLERSGYVSRGRDPQDRRRLLVRGTDEGLAAYERSIGQAQLEQMVAAQVENPERFRADLVALVHHLLPHTTEGLDPKRV